MTGIERLRELAQKHRIIEHYLTADTIDSIADQIERETQPKRDSAADVSMSAYDLLPQEDREAIAWVRENGGLGAVKRHWDGYVPASWLEKAKSSYQRKRDNLKAHAMGLERKCAERRERIRELERERDELRPRLMPEGMEWLVEAWPRFEDDAPVRFLDDFERYGDENGVSAVTMYSDGSFALNCRAYSKGEHVNRPATKVLDADGAEIRVGDELWHVSGYGPRTVGKVNADGSFCFGRCERAYKAEEFTHRAPVLAADGKPLREGETVWDVDGGGPYEVEGFVGKPLCVMLKSGINHEMPRDPSELAHERPESWERLEEDATIRPEAYCVKRGIDFSDVDGQHRVLDEVTERMARDLVRRARALAERGQ